MDANSSAGYSWSHIAQLQPSDARMIAVGYADFSVPVPLASMNDGRLFAFLPAPQEIPVPNGRLGYFSVVQILRARGSASAAAYLLLNGVDTRGDAYGFVYSFDRDGFVRLVDGLPTGGDGHLFGLAYDELNDTLFVTTESTVYRRNKVGLWTTATWGLPANPKCQGLVWAAELDGSLSLYLSTAGRSMWVARVGTWTPPLGPIEYVNPNLWMPTVR